MDAPIYQKKKKREMDAPTYQKKEKWMHLIKKEKCMQYYKTRVILYKTGSPV